jgi:cytochrome c oxidase assembly protein subunit 15
MDQNRRIFNQSNTVRIARIASNWLLCVAALVVFVVAVGGITRLTESGLSITEWQPFSGSIPPLSHAEWAEAFRKYQTIPEYIEINGPAGMTLAQFKVIFFWEWVHRLLGRVIGLALLLPWLFFAFCRLVGPSSDIVARWQLPTGYLARIFALCALVGLQGTIGWWMVASGLSERTDVSHFRLSVHLLTALTILGGLVWTALDLRNLATVEGSQPAKMQAFPALVLALLFLQLLFGAWVAGLNAGYVSNSWPLMNGRLYPDGVDWSLGTLYALTHDPFLLHFIHRWWAWVVVIALIVLARRVRAAGMRPASIAIHSAFGVQILLGIATVMSGMNITLAVLHQAVGALLVASTVWGAHILGRQSA